MKIFFIKLSRFIFILLLPIVFVYFLTGYFHKFLSHEQYYNNEFTKAFYEKNIDLIALGNSKLLASLDISMLSQAFDFKAANLGYVSSNISSSKLILESYLMSCDTVPKFVLLEVSWFTFNSKRTSYTDIVGDLVFNNPRLLPKMVEYFPEIFKNLNTTVAKQLISKIVHSKRGDYSSIIKEKRPYEKSYNFSLKKFERVFPTHYAGIDNKLLKDYYTILDICKKNDIELILYSAPVDKEYSSNQKDSKVIKKIFTSSLGEKYLDYTFGSKLWNDKFVFWLRDPDHLNENELFTRVLIKDLKENGYFNN